MHRQIGHVLTLAMVCALFGCEQRSTPVQSLSNDDIAKLLDARLLERKCGPSSDPAGCTEPTPKPVTREFHAMVRRVVDGEQVVCGMYGDAPINRPGGLPTPMNDEVFVLQGRKLTVGRPFDGDLSAGAFKQLQTRLCGTQWEVWNPIFPAVQ